MSSLPTPGATANNAVGAVAGASSAQITSPPEPPPQPTATSAPLAAAAGAAAAAAASALARKDIDTADDLEDVSTLQDNIEAQDSDYDQEQECKHTQGGAHAHSDGENSERLGSDGEDEPSSNPHSDSDASDDYGEGGSKKRRRAAKTKPPPRPLQPVNVITSKLRSRAPEVAAAESVAGPAAAAAAVAGVGIASSRELKMLAGAKPSKSQLKAQAIAASTGQAGRGGQLPHASGQAAAAIQDSKPAQQASAPTAGGASGDERAPAAAESAHGIAANGSGLNTAHAGVGLVQPPHANGALSGAVAVAACKPSALGKRHDPPPSTCTSGTDDDDGLGKATGSDQAALRPAAKQKGSKKQKRGSSQTAGDSEEGMGSEHAGGSRGQSEDEESASGHSEDEDMEEVIPERALSDAQVAEQLASVQGMWQLAAVLDFLVLFAPRLGGAAAVVAQSTPVEVLVDALVRAQGPGVLADLHLALLQGICRSPKLGPSTWAAFLASRLALDFSTCSAQVRATNPFRPQKGHEAREYALLPASQRVLALQVLCDMRAQRDDLHDLIDDAAMPPKPSKTSGAAGSSRGGSGGSSKASGPAPPPPRGSSRLAGGVSGAGVSTRKMSAADAAAAAELDKSEVRKEAFGVDVSGCTYWLVGRPQAMAVTLYREDPPLPGTAKAEPASPAAGSTPAGAKGKGRKPRGKPKKPAYVVPPDANEGRWRSLGSSIEELRAVGEKLARSKRKDDTQLAAKILDQLVLTLEEAAEQAEREAKARARVAAALGNSWGFATNGGRSKRERKVVDYTGAAYDKAFVDAMKASRHSGYGESPPPSSAGAVRAAPAPSQHAANLRGSTAAARVAASGPDVLTTGSSQLPENNMGSRDGNVISLTNAADPLGGQDDMDVEEDDAELQDTKGKTSNLGDPEHHEGPSLGQQLPPPPRQLPVSGGGGNDMPLVMSA